MFKRQLSGRKSIIVSCFCFVLACVCGFADAAELPVYGKLGGDIDLDVVSPDRLEQAKVKLVSFGFVNCADACPMMLAKYAQLLRNIDQSEFVALFVSIDVGRDSLSDVQKHVDRFDERILGLTGGQVEIDETLKQFAAFVEKNPLTGDYDHTDRIYLLDESDRVRAMFKPSDSNRAIVKTVESLL